MCEFTLPGIFKICFPHHHLGEKRGREGKALGMSQTLCGVLIWGVNGPWHGLALLLYPICLFDSMRETRMPEILSVSAHYPVWILTGTIWRGVTRFWKELRLRLQLKLSSTPKKENVSSWDRTIITADKFKIYEVSNLVPWGLWSLRTIK